MAPPHTHTHRLHSLGSSPDALGVSLSPRASKLGDLGNLS